MRQRRQPLTAVSDDQKKVEMTMQIVDNHSCPQKCLDDHRMDDHGGSLLSDSDGLQLVTSVAKVNQQNKSQKPKGCMSTWRGKEPDFVMRLPTLSKPSSHLSKY